MANSEPPAAQPAAGNEPGSDGRPARGALESVRVLDLSRVLAGPWSMQILGDLGADIVKVERPGEGDEARHWGPPWIKKPDGSPSGESAYFMGANRNKRSIAIDISKPDGRELVLELARSSDIFIENYKVGTMKRYGLDYETMRRYRPDIIYVSLTGFGQQGPYADRPGYDYLFQGLGGLMSITGEPDNAPGGGPQRIGIPLVDLFTGMYTTVAILAALNHRHATGEGQYIDMSLFDTVLAVGANPLVYSLVTGKPQGRTGKSSPAIAPYGVFPASDGLFIVASANQAQWVTLCKAIGHPQLATDARFATNGDRIANLAEMQRELSQIFSKQTREHWENVLTAAGVPVGPINDYFQAIEHPQARFRQSVRSLRHSLGVDVPTVSSPLRLGATPVRYRRPPPLLGEHTVEVLKERLGLDDAQISKLGDTGTIQ